MKPFLLALTLAVAAMVPVLPQKSGNPFAGRWDMTATSGNDKYPSWMEVTEKGGGLDVRVQCRTEHVRPVAAVKMDGSRLLLTVLAATPARPASEGRPAMPARRELTWELTATGGKLSGTQLQGERKAQLVGVRAPELKRAAPKVWTAPEPLFNGKDLSGWQPINNTPDTLAGPLPSHWGVKNGELVNDAKGSNLRTTRTFDDFKLHVEYNCPPGENSGIYLRGRYEAQVGPPPQAPWRPSAVGGQSNPYPFVGCIYGMVGPSSPPPFQPEWQTYDITLIGRWVTVIFNGVTTINNQEIAGITGGALDSNEAEPGPIYFQDDHHGGIRYRSITISVPKR